MDDDDLEASLRRVMNSPSTRMPDSLVPLEVVYAGAGRRRARRRAASAVAGVSTVAVVLAGFGAWHLLDRQVPVAPLLTASSSTPANLQSQPPSSLASTSAVPTTAVPTSSGPTSSALVVPVGYSPISVTAISADRWWVLGSDGLVAATTDGGTSFALTSPMGLGRDARQIRFANNADGWAITGSSAGSNRGTLWATFDGGRTWAGVGGLDGAASAVEAGGGNVFATTQLSDGTWSVWTSPIGKNGWHKLGSLGAIVATQAPLLAVQSGRAVVVGSNQDKVRAWVFTPAGGRTELATPCTPDVGPADLSATASSMWLVCHNGSGDSLYSSSNATTWTPVPAATPLASRLSVGGIDATRAAVGLQDGTIRLVSTTALTATLGKGGPRTQNAWTYVAFTNPSDGFALEDPGGLLRTADGGLTWKAVDFS